MVYEACAPRLTRACYRQPGGSGLLTNWSIRAKNPSIAPTPMDTASRSLKRRSARTPSSPSSIDSGYESLGTSSGNSSSTGERSADESTQPPPQSVVVQTRILKDASRAFFGQINNHSQAAKEKMRCLRVARLSTPDRQDEDDD